VAPASSGPRLPGQNQAETLPLQERSTVEHHQQAFKPERNDDQPSLWQIFGPISLAQKLELQDFLKIISSNKQLNDVLSEHGI